MTTPGISLRRTGRARSRAWAVSSTSSAKRARNSPREECEPRAKDPSPHTSRGRLPDSVSRAARTNRAIRAISASRTVRPKASSVDRTVARIAAFTDWRVAFFDERVAQQTPQHAVEGAGLQDGGAAGPRLDVADHAVAMERSARAGPEESAARRRIAGERIRDAAGRASANLIATMDRMSTDAGQSARPKGVSSRVRSDSRTRRMAPGLVPSRLRPLSASLGTGVVLGTHGRPAKPPEQTDLPDMRERVGNGSLKEHRLRALDGRFQRAVERGQIRRRTGRLKSASQDWGGLGAHTWRPWAIMAPQSNRSQMCARISPAVRDPSPADTLENPLGAFRRALPPR